MNDRTVATLLTTVLFLAVLAPAQGCSTEAASSSDTPSALERAPDAASGTAQDDGAHGDGAAAPDVVDALARAKAALARGDVAIDLDGDGRAELTVTRDGTGGMVGAAIDVDGDGAADLIWDMSSVPRTFTAKDRGIIVERTESTPDTTNPAIVRIVKTFTPRDTKLEASRLSYTFDPELATLSILEERDTNRDGVFDDGSFSRTEKAAQEATGDVVSVDTSCDAVPDATAELEAAISTSIRTGLTCLGGLSPTMRSRFAFALLSRSFTISCAPQAEAPNACASAPEAGKELPMFSHAPTPIHVFPALFDPSQCSATLSSYVFHEMMHYVLGLHSPGQGGGVADPVDRVYGCQHTCFDAPKATTLTCAACLGVGNEDPACGGFRKDDCTYAVCACDGRASANELSCVAACPLGLDCYANRCLPLAQCLH